MLVIEIKAFFSIIPILMLMTYLSKLNGGSPRNCQQAASTILILFHVIPISFRLVTRRLLKKVASLPE